MKNTLSYLGSKPVRLESTGRLPKGSAPSGRVLSGKAPVGRPEGWLTATFNGVTAESSTARVTAEVIAGLPINCWPPIDRLARGASGALAASS